jgi:hypothetical protein
MNKIGGLTILISVALAGGAAAETESMATLFPLRAHVSASNSGLCRLELTPEVVSACRADLADLRILTGDGREIPYIVDSPEPADTSLAVEHGAQLEVLNATRSQQALDDRVTVYRESFELQLPPPPAEVQIWELVLSIVQPEFVSRLEVKAIDRNGMRSSVISESAFRLPRADAEKVRFTFAAPGVESLEVFLETENTGYLQPRFAVVSSRLLPTTPFSGFALEIREIRTLGGTTEIILDRPRGLMPRRLMISTSTDTFHRRVTVWDEGPGARPDALGVATILQVAAIAPVAVLEVPMQAPRGDRLRLVVENQDSPPLDDLSVSALMPRPVLVFSMPEASLEAKLYFGGGRARRPRYDLAALDPHGRLPVLGEGARLALAVLDPDQAQIVTLGPTERNPEYDASPALAFAMHPGAAIDTRQYSHRRRVEMLPSSEGLSRIRLEPSDLAVLREDLADLRLVDDRGRQWAYLRQYRARSMFSTLKIAGHTSKDRVSTYEIEIPEGSLAINRLEIQTEAPFFDRDFTLRGRLDGDSERQLASGRLIRRAGDPRPSTLTVEPMRVVGLELEVHDGDDAPLDILHIEARSLVPDVYATATAGSYDLLLGYPDAEAPVYELERVRSTILAVPAGEAALGELGSNPEFSAASRISGSSSAQRILLWAVLGLAVIVLILITLRAAQQEAH